MFEGWLYPLIASYLGHYVKGLQKEQARPFRASSAPKRGRSRAPATQLRVGLWSGVVRLENVDLRLEVRGASPKTRGNGWPRRRLICPLRATQAFDYLALPFAIRSGTAGRLELQARASRSCAGCVAARRRVQPSAVH